MIRGSVNDWPIPYEYLSGGLELTNGEIILRSQNVFLFRCPKALSSLDEKNQVLKLLLVTFDVNLVVSLDLSARNALVSPVL